MPQVMEPDGPHLGCGPEAHVAPWTLPGLGVRRQLRFPAALPAADVAVARHDARPPEGPAQHVLQGHVLPHHGPVLGGEHQRRGRAAERLLEERHQFGGNGDDVRVTALGRVPRPRAAHGEQPAGQVHVRLPQGQQLPLAEPRVERRGEERAPALRQCAEQARHLLHAQEVTDAARDGALLHVRDGVGTAVASNGARLVEGTADEAPQVVDRLRGQFLFLLLQEHPQPGRRHRREGEGGEAGGEQVARDLAHVARMGRGVDRTGVEPPAQQLRQRSASILGQSRLQPEPLPLGLLLKLRRNPPGLRLRARLGHLVAPPASRVLDPQIPLARLLIDARHGYRFPVLRVGFVGAGPVAVR